jgi:hypothetical protein
VPPRDAVRILAIGRIALGVAMLLFPRIAAAAWVGRDAATPGASVLARALGVRDAVFGGMLLHTLDHPQVAQRWTAACGACDLVDGSAAVAVRSSLPPVRGRAGAVFALAAGAAHLALSRQLAADAVDAE